MSTVRDARVIREVQEDALPGETAAIKVPPRNRWQVLLLEYELLDAYWAATHQRVWMSGLVLVGLSMLGLTFLASTMKPGEVESLQMIGLIGGVSSLLTAGWWLLLRRLFSAERVAEYRKNEIERELGMRSGIYLTFLRQSRLFGARRAASAAREMAEGDLELEQGIKEFSTSSEGRPWLPRFMADRLVWSLVPWVLIAAWGGLYLLKWGGLSFLK
ncbi:MAG: hypothetical protein HY531_02880 [Chloroflexi bacterium]|nr:hypothetical protein [Chloroflexota bacterium]